MVNHGFKRLCYLSFLLFVFFSFFIFPRNVLAHAFGQSYTLPLPAWLYYYGGGAVVVVSFLVASFFVEGKRVKSFFKKVELFKRAPLLRFIVNRFFIRLLQLKFLFLFILAILTGFLGSNLASFNFNMTFFWIMFFLGFSYFVVIFGNWWGVINPFKLVVNVIGEFFDLEFQGIVKLGDKIKYLPAFLLYLFLIYFELAGTTPYSLSVILLSYTILNIIATIIFGKEYWFKYGEIFEVLFGLLGRASAFYYESGKYLVRLPFSGYTEKIKDFSLLLVILFLLSSTAFDGFRSTTAWIDLVFPILSPMSPLMAVDVYNKLQVLGIIVSPLFFLTLYLLAIWVMKMILKSKESLIELSKIFAYSLVPIGIVYNIAHYYNLLILQGQDIYRLISDPFGFGWNLFGTAFYEINISLLQADFVWHSQLFLIIFGHVVGVILSHILAMKYLGGSKRVIISQLPMLILMVFYTVCGLWILSAPIALGE